MPDVIWIWFTTMANFFLWVFWHQIICFVNLWGFSSPSQMMGWCLIASSWLVFLLFLFFFFFSPFFSLFFLISPSGSLSCQIMPCGPQWLHEWWALSVRTANMEINFPCWFTWWIKYLILYFSLVIASPTVMLYKTPILKFGTTNKIDTSNTVLESMPNLRGADGKHLTIF